MEVIDLFCSAGGSSLGAKLAGHNVTHAYDINSIALDAYQENHPEVEIHEEDIMQLTAADLPKADILMGSTPCTSFSQINMFTKDFDMSLTNKFFEIVIEYRKLHGKIIWVCENVPTILKFLPKGTPGKIHLVADYGVPQKRKRWMGGNYKQPRKTHAESPCGDLKPWVKFKYIKSENGWKPISMAGLAGAFKRSNKMGRRGHSFDVQFIGDDDVLSTILSSQYHGLRAGSMIIYDNGVCRNLAFLECQRAQSFPDEYVFKGNMKERWRQLGDAVPPLLMRAILSQNNLQGESYGR